MDLFVNYKKQTKVKHISCMKEFKIYFAIQINCHRLEIFYVK